MGGISSVQYIGRHWKVVPSGVGVYGHPVLYFDERALRVRHWSSAGLLHSVLGSVGENREPCEGGRGSDVHYPLRELDLTNIGDSGRKPICRIRKPFKLGAEVLHAR